MRRLSEKAPFSTNACAAHIGVHMGLFDFLDARVSTARWGAKWIRAGAAQGLTAKQAALVALQTRYVNVSLGRRESEVLAANMEHCEDVFDLCHTVAEIELLNKFAPIEIYNTSVGGRNLREHTYSVIDEELRTLGFSRTAQPRTQQAVTTAAKAEDTGGVLIVVVAAIILMLGIGFISDQTSENATQNATTVPASNSYTATPAPATPTPRPKMLSRELSAMYEQLQKERAALDAGDAEAIMRFNEQAARYKRAVEEARADRLRKGNGE